jgi:hypothetical protein
MLFLFFQGMPALAEGRIADKWKTSYCFSLGSRASIRPSPIRLNIVTVIKIAKPGNIATHHACGTPRASDSILPQVTCSGGTPIPRNDKLASGMAEDDPPLRKTQCLCSLYILQAPHSEQLTAYIPRYTGPAGKADDDHDDIDRWLLYYSHNR